MKLKMLLKKNIETGKRIDSNELYEVIEKFPCVSFDIFDTLIKRNVAEPEDIFEIMEKQVGQGFKDKRIRAEQKARKELGKKEINLIDIYQYFPENDAKRLLNLELKIEEDSIVPNQPVAEVYNRCVKANKMIYLTSDMYWPEDAIRKLLEKNGFGSYQNLYLSSTQQKVKSDGSLFKLLLEREGINCDELIHIGDSLQGDYKGPKKLGIHTIRIPRHFKNIAYRGDNKNSNISLNYLNHFINNTFPYNEDPYYQFGYTQFGKLLYGFVNWLHDEAVARGIKKLFFFARDGYIMKKAYEICINSPDIEIFYLEVSRRSLRGPVLWMDCSFATILKMVVNAKLISLKSIFDGLGLDIADYSKTINDCNLNVDTLFDRETIADDIRLKKLFEIIKNDIITNSQKEYSLLQAYLKKYNVNGKFGVVDIGYAGSMQRYMQQVLTQMGIEHDISGFYFAVADFYKKNLLDNVKLDLNGYLFDFQHDEHAIDTRSSFVGLFETLFLEQGGSVKRYINNDGEISVERYPYEYEIDGKPTGDLLKVRKVQQGALDFLKRAKKDNLLATLRCRPNEYFYGLYKTGIAPFQSDIDLFANLSFFDEGVTERLAAPKGFFHYLVYPKHFKIDFLKCRWKIGFLKRTFLVCLPYQRIYRVLKCIGARG